MSVWAVVVAAGGGTRFGGDVPKQYLSVGGRRVLDWSLAAARAATDGIVLVVPRALAGEPEAAADVVVAGGATRSASVRAGLAAVPDDARIIVVHDAARPAASVALFRRVIDAVVGDADAAVPGIEVTDTIKRVADGVVVDTPDRASLVAVQTPQAFRAPVLREAHAAASDASDDAALVEHLGGRVVVVPGEVANRKVTRPEDLHRVEASLGARGPSPGN